MKNILIILFVLVACSSNTKENTDYADKELIAVEGYCKLFRVKPSIGDYFYWSVCNSNYSSSLLK